MKLLLLPVAALLAASTLNAQEKTLKQVLELKIPREGGANGAGVAWHPVLKKYYAAMAGNTEFSLSVFDAAGKRLSPVEQKTHFDIRGIWYNPTAKAIQMNGYADFGWATYKLDKDGLPTSAQVFAEGENQPGEQNSGAYDAKGNVVYFMNENGVLEKYSAKGEYLEEIQLYLGDPEEDDGVSTNADLIEDYNQTSIVFTGMKNAEIGLLNSYSKMIELYDISTGFMTKKYKLPEDAPVKDWLNFSYSNSLYWLFDTNTRIWKGYK